MGEKRTYIINIDGMRADYINLTGHQGCLTPNLNMLAKQGTSFTRCYDILPSNTSTNHTAIMTGVYAGTSGVLGATGCFQGLDLDRPRRSLQYGAPKCVLYKHAFLQIPTFFNIIKENNPDLVTALIVGKTWIGNILGDEDTDITIYPGNTEDNCDAHKPNPDYVKDPDGYVLGGLPHPEDNAILPRFYIRKFNEKKNNPPGSFLIPIADFNANHLPSDDWTIQQAISCVNHENPDFMYMILENVDLIGHFCGSAVAEIESDEIEVEDLNLLRNPDAVRDQLFLTDAAIGRFVKHLKTKGLYDDARILVTADHGMNTIKRMRTGESTQNILSWMLGRFNLSIIGKLRETSPKNLVERLDIDVRKILKDNGIHMRAAELKALRRYNPRGAYDWCISDGGSACYLYNATSETQEKIKNILMSYTVKEKGKTIHPVWRVLIEKDMEDAVNEYTGEPFGLKRGDFTNGYEPAWPCIMAFLRPHFMVPIYNDHFGYGINPIKITINVPPFIDLRSANGMHGTYSEQSVPLIFVSGSEKIMAGNTVVNRQVSILDILPTITQLNGWKIPSQFVGKSLFKKQKVKLPPIQT